MKELKPLFDNNKAWAAKINSENPEFFRELAKQQYPQYLWIGCADSRVPANEIVGLPSGSMFVHRNIANMVIHTDLNCLSVIQYAVEVLKIKHIIVCGHYGCGGVKAAMQQGEHGLIDNWLRHIKDIYRYHRKTLEAIQDEEKRLDTLCELNVIEQVANICHTTIIQNAWKIGQEVHVHGWIYSIADGILHDMDVCISSPESIRECYRVKQG